MRSQFKGHFGDPPEEIDVLWREATFVFDANVLLNLYRYSDRSRKDFLNLMSEIRERCWLPEQCVHEFLSNRLAVIRDQMKAYSETEKTIDTLKATFTGAKGHPFVTERSLRELEAVLGKVGEELNKKPRSARRQSHK